MSGYARIHRSMLGHPAFRSDAEALAFGWMIIRAAWRPTRVRYKDRIINLQRGQLAVSQRDMARSMERDKAWVERLWRRLRSEAMIETHVEAGITIVTVCSYEKYQADAPTGEAVGEAPGEAVNEAGARQGRGTEQRREENNNNHTRARLLADGWEPRPFGPGSDAAEIVAGWPDGELKRQIERFADHHRAKGNKFADWQAAWGTWVRNSSNFKLRGREVSTSSSADFDLVEAINSNPDRWRGSG